MFDLNEHQSFYERVSFEAMRRSVLKFLFKSFLYFVVVNYRNILFVKIVVDIEYFIYWIELYGFLICYEK